MFNPRLCRSSLSARVVTSRPTRPTFKLGPVQLSAHCLHLDTDHCRPCILWLGWKEFSCVPIKGRALKLDSKVTIIQWLLNHLLYLVTNNPCWNLHYRSFFAYWVTRNANKCLHCVKSASVPHLVVTVVCVTCSTCRCARKFTVCIRSEIKGLVWIPNSLPLSFIPLHKQQACRIAAVHVWPFICT